VWVGGGGRVVRGPGGPGGGGRARGGGEFRAPWEPSVKIVFEAAALGEKSPAVVVEQGEAFRAVRVR